MNSRLLKRLSAVVALAFAGTLVLLVGQKPASVQGASEEEEHGGLVGTWNVTLKFPVCSTACPCPGGVPNIPISALHTYQKGETLLEVPGGTLFRGPGVGTWERVDADQSRHASSSSSLNPTGAAAPQPTRSSRATLT